MKKWATRVAAAVAALFVPFSGLLIATNETATEPDFASHTESAVATNSRTEHRAPTTGTVSPDTGSVSGGETVTITLAEAPQITQSAHGADFGLATTSTGEVTAWGGGEAGQLCDGEQASSLTPVLLTQEVFGDQEVIPCRRRSPELLRAHSFGSPVRVGWHRTDLRTELRNARGPAYCLP